MTGSVQGRGEVLLEASNYEQIVGSFPVTRINGHCFNREPSARARSPAMQNVTQTRTTHRLQKVTDFPGRSLG